MAKKLKVVKRYSEIGVNSKMPLERFKLHGAEYQKTSKELGYNLSQTSHKSKARYA